MIPFFLIRGYAFLPFFHFSFLFSFPFLSGIKQSFDRSVNIGSNSFSIENTFLIPSVTATINAKPLLLSQIPNLSECSTKELHFLVEKGSFELLAWTVSSKSYLQKEYQKNLPLLSQMLEDQAQSLITNRPGWSGIAGVVGGKLIQLHVLWIYFRFF